MRQYRYISVIGIGALGFAVALAMGACETTRNPGGIQRDVTQRNIALSTTAGVTQDVAGGLRVNGSANDNLALKRITLRFSGGLVGTLVTTFNGRAKTDTDSHTLHV